MNPESMFVECQGAAGPHRVHVLKWPNRAATTTLPPVICVHGLTRMGYDFCDIAAALSCNRDVYSLTMAGRGKSDWLSDYAHYTYPTYVADCLFIIRETLKLTQVDWLGTSMGGLIGMWVASLDKKDGTAEHSPPALIRKLVLNDIGPFLPLTAIQRIAFYAGRSQNFNTMDEAERHCRAIYADFGIKTDKDWQFFAEHTVRVKEDGGLTLHYDPSIAKVFADVKEDVSVWPMYDSISCPTLLLRGVRSDVLSKDIAQQMTRQGPKATLVTFENCGHAPALIDAEQINVVKQFLE
ncbi:MAG: alpha/beta hydrolase [Alphaproteobacteria bacterium]|nr:alpha/beta hydrolase [Alphaproteobacteria bacterium]